MSFGVRDQGGENNCWGGAEPITSTVRSEGKKRRGEDDRVTWGETSYRIHGLQSICEGMGTKAEVLVKMRVKSRSLKSNQPILYKDNKKKRLGGTFRVQREQFPHGVQSRLVTRNLP